MIHGILTLCGRRMALLLLGLLTFSFEPVVAAQDASAAPKTIPATSLGKPTEKEALRALVAQILELKSQIAAKQNAIDSAKSSEQSASLVDEMRDLERQREDARFDLLNVLTDVNLSKFHAVEEKPFTLQGSIEDLLRPLIQEVRQATQGSRQRHDLETRFEIARQREEVLSSALQALDGAIAQAQEENVKAELVNLRQEYGVREAQERDQLTVLGYRLQRIESERKSLVGETSGLVASFFRERGRNLLLSFLAAFCVAVGFRIFHQRLRDHSDVFKKGRSSSARLLDVILYLSTFLGALIAAILVLVIAGDWVLMGLVVLLLIGLILGAKDALPGYMNEIRMILNMGPVRENERIVFNGVPWLVENLTFFTILRNPALQGGMIRMPIAQLQGMLSRPAEEDEPYFPSYEGDWVLLGESVYGEVIFQSVEMVQLRLLGGALKMFSTPNFLALNPQNHSHGFRILSRFGIDYDHQAASTGEILEKLRAFFQGEVTKRIEPHALKSLKLNFAEASASSLDYDVLLDLDGCEAQRYRLLQRALQQIAVDACNRLELVIPFQQITLHQHS